MNTDHSYLTLRKQVGYKKSEWGAQVIFFLWTRSYSVRFLKRKQKQLKK